MKLAIQQQRKRTRFRVHICIRNSCIWKIRDNEKLSNFYCVLMPIFWKHQKLPSVRFPLHKFTMMKIKVIKDKRVRRVEQLRCRFFLIKSEEWKPHRKRPNFPLLHSSAKRLRVLMKMFNTRRKGDLEKINIKILSFSFPFPFFFFLRRSFSCCAKLCWLILPSFSSTIARFEFFELTLVM